MAAKFDLIADVNALKYDWFVVARVLRLWEVTAGDRIKTTTSIEMVLVDEKINLRLTSLQKPTYMEVIQQASKIPGELVHYKCITDDPEHATTFQDSSQGSPLFHPCRSGG